MTIRERRAIRFSLYLILSLSLCVVPAGCRKRPQNTRLIGELESYQSIDQVRSRLLTTPKDWKIIQDSRPDPAKEDPRVGVITISLQNYKHLGVPGELILHFFNNRLVSTVFFPTDFPAYKAGLEERERIKFDQVEIFRRPRTRIWIGKDSRKRDCIGWEDTALRNEIDQWLAQNK
ncbi:MAG TPA: hypothetical protein VGL91_15225 [Acidobacteriota bacterium]